MKQNLFEGVLDSGSKTDYVDFSSKGRSQFIDQLESFLNETKDEAVADGSTQAPREDAVEHEDDFAEDLGPLAVESTADDAADEQRSSEREAPVGTSGQQPSQHEAKAGESDSKTAELEQVMTSGMQFLAGLYKMSTGKDMGIESNQIKINKETGEVTMTFKLPV